jgi:protein-S-isoprenylcysteine O-methyltransferase Ste14
MTSEVKRQVVGWAVKAVIARAVSAAILFLAAGTLKWAMGWAFAALYAAFDVATALVVIPKSPDLLLERTAVKAGTKAWDKVLVRIAAGYLPIATWIVAGLDLRWGWQPEVGSWLQLASAVVVALGFGIIVWAMAANAFFSVTVRIQTERDHTVATGGPYRFVRHPGYVGAILFQTAMALMLGSWWALIPAGLSAVTYVVRTALEDRTLRAELPGYAEYTRQTRYRLLPGVW